MFILFPNFNTVIKTEFKKFYYEIKENIVKSIIIIKLDLVYYIGQIVLMG